MAASINRCGCNEDSCHSRPVHAPTILHSYGWNSLNCATTAPNCTRCRRDLLARSLLRTCITARCLLVPALENAQVAAYTVAAILATIALRDVLARLGATTDLMANGSNRKCLNKRRINHQLGEQQSSSLHVMVEAGGERQGLNRAQVQVRSTRRRNFEVVDAMVIHVTPERGL